MSSIKYLSLIFLIFDLRKLFSEAFQWLVRRRKKHPPSSDIWDFRRGREDNIEPIANIFRKGAYQFDLQKKITLSGGERIAVWSSRDALVLKVLTWIIQEILKPVLSKSCYHLKGHGGLKGAVRDVMEQIQNTSFVAKRMCKVFLKKQICLFLTAYSISSNMRYYLNGK